MQNLYPSVAYLFSNAGNNIASFFFEYSLYIFIIEQTLNI